MSDTPTPQEYPAAPGSSDDTPGAYAAAPEGPEGEPPMSAAETLSGIFFEPGRTFEHLRRRPRFLAAALVVLALTTAFVVVTYARVNYDDMVRRAIESNERTADMPAEQKEQIIRMQTSPFVKGLAYASPAIGLTIFFFLGGALYLLGAMAMGKGVSYWQALSVWVYSSLPPALLFCAANIILLFLKSAEDISPESAQRGLARANLSVFVNPFERPVLATLLGLVDIFAIYGLVLAATGMRKVARLSAGSAWAVVLAIWLTGGVLRIALAMAFGQPMA